MGNLEIEVDRNAEYLVVTFIFLQDHLLRERVFPVPQVI
jgi:hypothetical protein